MAAKNNNSNSKQENRETGEHAASLRGTHSPAHIRYIATLHSQQEFLLLEQQRLR